MQITEFGLTKYRSIKKAENIRLGSLTVMIGPNNEGKSNVLSGLTTAMRSLKTGGVRRRPSGVVRTREDPFRYNWERDFPVDLQEREPDGETAFNLTFEFTDQEVVEFKDEVGSDLNGTLPIELRIGSGTRVFTVLKQGRGHKTLNSKSGKIAEFIGKRVNLQDVPAVRQAKESEQIATEMIQSGFRELENREEYREVVEKIKELQKPVLDDIGERMSTMLGTFLHDVKSVTLEPYDHYRSLRDCRVVVDDGTATGLRTKGHGVQSLAAISLIHHASERTLDEREIILAIEEPEAHLHPEAIHKVRDVLFQISEKQQVILTTHSPLLVNRDDIASNIIVRGGHARPAKSIANIREILGVRVSDNLTQASHVLLVEGECDRRALDALLRNRSEALASAISSGVFVVQSLYGCAKLSKELSDLRRELCEPLVLLDNDRAGQTAADTALEEGLIKSRSLFMTNCTGMSESEFEDWIDPLIYADRVKSEFGVDLDTNQFRARNSKWTTRLKREFKANGKHWRKNDEVKVKEILVDAVEKSPENAITVQDLTSFNSLVYRLEEQCSGSIPE